MSEFIGDNEDETDEEIGYETLTPSEIALDAGLIEYSNKYIRDHQPSLTRIKGAPSLKTSKSYGQFNRALSELAVEHKMSEMGITFSESSSAYANRITNGRCPHCGAQMLVVKIDDNGNTVWYRVDGRRIQYDHVAPASRGWPGNVPGAIQSLCDDCNQAKKDTQDAQWVHEQWRLTKMGLQDVNGYRKPWEQYESEADEIESTQNLFFGPARRFMHAIGLDWMVEQATMRHLDGSPLPADEIMDKRSIFTRLISDAFDMKIESPVASVEDSDISDEPTPWTSDRNDPNEDAKIRYKYLRLSRDATNMLPTSFMKIEDLDALIPGPIVIDGNAAAICNLGVSLMRWGAEHDAKRDAGCSKSYYNMAMRSFVLFMEAYGYSEGTLRDIINWPTNGRPNGDLCILDILNMKLDKSGEGFDELNTLSRVLNLFDRITSGPGSAAKNDVLNLLKRILDSVEKPSELVNQLVLEGESFKDQIDIDMNDPDNGVIIGSNGLTVNTTDENQNQRSIANELRSVSRLINELRDRVGVDDRCSMNSLKRGYQVRNLIKSTNEDVKKIKIDVFNKIARLHDKNQTQYRSPESAIEAIEDLAYDEHMGRDEFVNAVNDLTAEKSNMTNEGRTPYLQTADKNTIQAITNQICKNRGWEPYELLSMSKRNSMTFITGWKRRHPEYADRLDEYDTFYRENWSGVQNAPFLSTGSIAKIIDGLKMNDVRADEDRDLALVKHLIDSPDYDRMDYSSKMRRLDSVIYMARGESYEHDITIPVIMNGWKYADVLTIATRLREERSRGDLPFTRHALISNVIKPDGDIDIVELEHEFQDDPESAVSDALRSRCRSYMTSTYAVKVRMAPRILAVFDLLDAVAEEHDVTVPILQDINSLFKDRPPKDFGDFDGIVSSIMEDLSEKNLSDFTMPEPQKVSSER
jgi:hypothetical protein